MTPSTITEVEADLRNIAAVLDADQSIRDELQLAARLGSVVNYEMVTLRTQVAYFANVVIDKAWEILGSTE